MLSLFPHNLGASKRTPETSWDCQPQKRWSLQSSTILEELTTSAATPRSHVLQPISNSHRTFHLSCSSLAARVIMVYREYMGIYGNNQFDMGRHFIAWNAVSKVVKIFTWDVTRPSEAFYIHPFYGPSHICYPRYTLVSGRSLDGGSPFRHDGLPPVIHFERWDFPWNKAYRAMECPIFAWQHLLPTVCLSRNQPCFLGGL